MNKSCPQRPFSTTSLRGVFKIYSFWQTSFHEFFYQKIVYMRHLQLTYPDFFEKRKKLLS
jgi:hypothetical protein